LILVILDLVEAIVSAITASLLRLEAAFREITTPPKNLANPS